MPVSGLCTVLFALAALYGCCMGWFGLFNRPLQPAMYQMLASMVKVPALFFLTLLVTFPSLYVFNALVGSRLTLAALVRLMVAALGVNLAVLASFGPIIAFFSVTTTNHPFILLLNVFFCAVAGMLGMVFLLQTLHRITVAMAPAEAAASVREEPVAAEVIEPLAGPTDSGVQRGSSAAALPTAAPLIPPAANSLDGGGAARGAGDGSGATSDGALDPLDGQVLGSHVKTVFRCWVILFALVGSQMSWVLRPFIGRLDEPFTLFCPRQSSFFEAVWHTITHLHG